MKNNKVGNAIVYQAVPALGENIAKYGIQGALGAVGVPPQISNIAAAPLASGVKSGLQTALKQEGYSQSGTLNGGRLRKSRGRGRGLKKLTNDLTHFAIGGSVIADRVNADPELALQFNRDKMNYVRSFKNGKGLVGYGYD